MPNDPKKPGPLELMKMLYQVLPEASQERADLAKVIAGLGTPDVNGAINNVVTFKTHNLERARALWPPLWATLRQRFPSNALVQELGHYYDVNGNLIDP